MNRNHPLDEVFRRKLEAYEVEIPPHIFGQIQEKRDREYLLILQIKRHLPLLVLYSLLLIIAFSFCFHYFSSFPPDNNSNQSSFIYLNNDSEIPSADLKCVTYTPENKEVSSKKPENVMPKPYIELPNYPIKKGEASNPQLENRLIQPVQKETAHIAKRIEKASLLEALTPLKKKETTPSLFKPGRNTILGFQRSPRCPQFGPDNWRIYLEALVAPDVPFKFISADVPDLEEYVAQREATEEQKLAFSTSLRLSLVSNKGMAFRVGATYSQINERFRYLNESETRTIITDIFDQNGNIIGTDTTLVLGTRYKVSQNKYRMIDVPVIFGYQFNRKSMRISVNGGMLVNLVFRQKGDVLSPVDLKPVSIDSGTLDAYPAFKQQAGLGWYGSLGLEYKMGSDLYLMVEPYVKSFPRSLTIDQYGVQQKYLHAGIFVGLKKPLN